MITRQGFFRRTALTPLLMSFAFVLALHVNSSAQILLNEVEVDTPSDITERCEYAEILGSPMTLVPANTFFLSIDGDAGVFGQVNYVADLSGVQFGANGTITIITNSDACAGRTYPAGTTIVQTNSFAMGFGAETFLLATSSNPGQIFEGQDLDQDNDRAIDPSFGINAIDGIGWTPDPTSSIFTLYAGVPDLGGPPFSPDVPDAATRFNGNVFTFNSSSWYYGELAPPEQS